MPGWCWWVEKGARLHEEIITAGGEITQGRFRRIIVTQVQAALDAATGRSVSAENTTAIEVSLGQFGGFAGAGVGSAS